MAKNKRQQALAQCSADGGEGERGECSRLTCESQVQQEVLGQMLLGSQIVQLYKLAHSG